MEMKWNLKQNGKTVAKLTTNHSISLEDALVMIGADNPERRYEDDPDYIINGVGCWYWDMTLEPADEFSEADNEVIDKYLDGCVAILRKTADGYDIECPEDTYHFSSAAEVIEMMKETIAEWEKVDSSADSRVGVPEAFYTGGGIYISALYVDENTYYAIDNDWYDDCFAIYDHRGEDDDVEFPCQNMVDSKNVADATEEEKRIYAILKAALDKEMA